MTSQGFQGDRLQPAPLGHYPRTVSETVVDTILENGDPFQLSSVITLSTFAGKTISSTSPKDLHNFMRVNSSIISRASAGNFLHRLLCGDLLGAGTLAGVYGINFAWAGSAGSNRA